MARRAKTPHWLLAAREADRVAQRGEWLSRALSRAGVLPTARAVEAVAHGRVRVDGRVVTQPYAPLSRSARVELDGALCDVAPRTLVLAFHKPKGLVVHGHDAEEVGTVFEALNSLLSPELQRYGWLAIGRLDRDTTGLLLFTNDEQLVAFATSPGSHLPKRYLARVGGTVTEQKLNALRTGVDLDGVRTLPAQAALRGPGVVELILTEGKYHQVKRMLAAVRLVTLELHREAVGDFALDVELGQLRRLSDREVEQKLHYVPRHRPAPPLR